MRWRLNVYIHHVSVFFFRLSSLPVTAGHRHGMKQRQGHSSEETHHILAGILERQHRSRFVCRYLEFGDNGDGLDLASPGEFNVMADPVRRLGRLDAGIDTACRRGKHLAKRNLHPGHILRRQGFEVGADKAAEQGGSDVIRMAFFKQLGTIARLQLICRNIEREKEENQGANPPIIKQKSKSLSFVR